MNEGVWRLRWVEPRLLLHDWYGIELGVVMGSQGAQKLGGGDEVSSMRRSLG
jgi:hypothetical protein